MESPAYELVDHVADPGYKSKLTNSIYLVHTAETADHSKMWTGISRVNRDLSTIFMVSS